MKGVILHTGEVVNNKTEAIERAKHLLDHGIVDAVDEVVILRYSNTEDIWFIVGYHEPDCVNYVQVKKEVA